jgi:hypothetical protein
MRSRFRRRRAGARGGAAAALGAAGQEAPGDRGRVGGQLAALPRATMRPPWTPAPGPRSMISSARRMVSSSCSTTMTLLPLSRSPIRVSMSMAVVALDAGRCWARRAHSRRRAGSSRAGRRADALGLAAGQRRRRAVQAQIAEPDLLQKAEPPAHLGEQVMADGRLALVSVSSSSQRAASVTVSADSCAMDGRESAPPAPRCSAAAVAARADAGWRASGLRFPASSHCPSSPVCSASNPASAEPVPKQSGTSRAWSCRRTAAGPARRSPCRSRGRCGWWNRCWPAARQPAETFAAPAPAPCRGPAPDPAAP